MKLRRSLFIALILGLIALPATVWAAPQLAEEHGGGANFFGLIPAIILFPLLGLLINLVAGQRMSEGWVGVIASSAAALSFVVAVLQAFSLAANEYHAVTVPLADWIVIGDLNIPWAFQVDTLSVTMMLVVTGVGTLIHIYAIGYMHGDVRHNGDPARFARFFIYLNLFLAAMLILVTGNNYLMLFVGWEGVGLCSFLLIGFWFEKGANNVGNARAARKAFVANRVGDWAMLLAMFLLFWLFGSLTFDNVFTRAAEIAQTAYGKVTITTACILFLIGAAGKSAQVPLYVWLPDAMAGPTPVSALIHAATMVTAGVYMMTRSSALFAVADPIASDAVAWVGAITAFFAATIAVGQYDIKKVLAYSTISQLGFMVAAVGLGGYVAGMFHLITHAFFKALLFLSSGSVIHAMEHGMHELHAHGGGGHEEHGGHDDHDAHADSHAPSATSHAPESHFDPQDMRNMGGLWSKLPVTKWVYLIGALALGGIFPLSGFWSKDEILLDASRHNQAIYLVLVIAAGFTAFYMTRQILMVFFGKARTPEAKHAGESPAVMLVPLVVLAVLSIFGGNLNLPTIGDWHPEPSVITPYGAHGLEQWLDHTLHPAAAGEVAEEAAGHEAPAGEAEASFDINVAGFSTGVALLAIALAFIVYRNKPGTVNEPDPLTGLGGVYRGMENKWWVDEIYQAFILGPYEALSRFFADVIDWRFWHDWFHDKVIAGLFNTFARLTADGVDLGFIDAVANGLADLSKGVAARFSRLQAGYVRGYAMAVFLGVVVVVGYFLIIVR
jgi:NADH-quinone oxidoreductase subunit L